MKLSAKGISVLITAAMTVVFVLAASFFALHYNSWFVEEDATPGAAVVSGTRLILFMWKKAGILCRYLKKTLTDSIPKEYIHGSRRSAKPIC